MDEEFKGVILEKGEIKESYKLYLSEHEARPKSLGNFCKTANFERKEVKVHYKTLKEIESDLWLDLYYSSRKGLLAQPEFSDYTVQEKFMAFIYTFLEILERESAWIEHLKRMGLGKFFIPPNTLSSFNEKFSAFLQQLIDEAVSSKELPDRPFLRKQYGKSAYALSPAILNFYINDMSEEKARTDAFIEKSITLIFDIIGFTAFDSAFDLGRFLIERK